MSTQFHIILKAFNKNVLCFGACLLLQGCSTWFSSSEKETYTNPQSTVVDSSTTKADTAAPIKEEISDAQKATCVNSQNLRALPKRPVVIEDDLPNELDETQDVNEPVTYYTIQRGDYLEKVARKFHVSIDAIVAENRLKNKNRIFVGQVLAIPTDDAAVVSLEEDTGDYTVRSGDSLSSIAKRFSTTTEKLRTDNRLHTDVIYIGQKLTIHGRNTPLRTSQNKEAPIGSETYVVQPGDTLGHIALRCGMSVGKLMEINHIRDPKRLRVGQELYVKAGSLKEEPVVNTPSVPEPIVENENVVSNEVPVEQHEESPSVENKDLDEEDFEDLFEGSNDIPVISSDEIK